MYTYPLYAMVARPKSTLLGQCGTAPSYVTDEEANALNEMVAVRQDIRNAQRDAQHLTGLLSAQGFLNQALTLVARLKDQHRSLHDRFLLANRHKHEALGHIKPQP